jgi:hypothetical protein
MIKTCHQNPRRSRPCWGVGIPLTTGSRPGPIKTKPLGVDRSTAPTLHSTLASLAELLVRHAPRYVGLNSSTE